MDVNTGANAKVIEHPFIILAKEETVVFNPDSGYLEIVEISDAGSSATGKPVGV